MLEKKSPRYNRLRKMLLDRKRKMWNELRRDLFEKLGKEYNTQFDNPHDIEELALIDFIEETGLTIADIRRKELEEMDRALARLEEGTYGECERCGAEIDEERLKVMPLAALCVDCQKASEGTEKKPTL